MGLVRFLLARAVVLCYSSAIFGYLSLSGNLAVQVFYIISGFYMATQLVFFVAGIFSYRLYRYYQFEKISRSLLKMGYGVFVALILVYYYVLDESYYKQIVLLIATTILIPFAIEITKRNRIDRYPRNISYPIYISQFLVIRFVNANRFPKVISKGFTALVLDIILAMVLDKIIGEGIEKFRQQQFVLLSAAKLQNAIHK